MAAATARLSPAANLLRHSRLFALPSVQSNQALQATANQVVRSDTATKPCPIRAAIETPLYSLNRGDWGLKRPLPLKSTTRTGTPVIRLNGAIDTGEHIADFDSAADHVLNLRKWQELQIAITFPEATTFNKDRNSKGVFTESVDNITKVSAAGQRRWRYAGPFLSSLTVMEFETYLKGEVRRRKDEFKERIRAHLVDERLSEHRKRSMEEGLDAEDMESLFKTAESDIVQHMRKLRSRPGEFGRLISDFLDLPDGPEPDNTSSGEQWEYRKESVASHHYRQVGPPRTHPSAGLSYLRTTSHARNDSERGPMENPISVPARVLRPIRVQTDRNNGNGRFGVAGFVADTIEAGAFQIKELEAAQRFTPQPGGTKLVVRPLNAAINPDGTVKLHVRRVAGNGNMYDEHREEAEEGFQGQGRNRAQQEGLLPATVMGSGSQMEQLDQPAYRQKSRFRQTGWQRDSLPGSVAKVDVTKERDDLNDLLMRGWQKQPA